jgi:hypothetical protein
MPKPSIEYDIEDDSEETENNIQRAVLLGNLKNLDSSDIDSTGAEGGLSDSQLDDFDENDGPNIRIEPEYQEAKEEDASPVSIQKYQNDKKKLVILDSNQNKVEWIESVILPLSLGEYFPAITTRCPGTVDHRWQGADWSLFYLIEDGKLVHSSV